MPPRKVLLARLLGELIVLRFMRPPPLRRVQTELAHRVAASWFSPWNCRQFLHGIGFSQQGLGKVVG